MRTILAILLLSHASNAQDSVDVKTVVEFERMKLKSYEDAHEQTQEILFVWVDYEDLEVYKHLRKQYPNAVHCFRKQFDSIQRGLVIGRKTKENFRRELDISVPLGGTVNTREVIDQFFKARVTWGHAVAVPQASPLIILSSPPVVECLT